MSRVNDKGERIVRCPTCGGDSIYAERNPFRPFCSARCKGVDFGAWKKERKNNNRNQRQKKKQS